MIARYINFFRNEKYQVIAGVASVVWQTSFPKTGGLRIDAHDSPTLTLLAKALEDDDVLGLTVRWNAYRTLYFDRSRQYGRAGERAPCQACRRRISAEPGAQRTGRRARTVAQGRTAGRARRPHALGAMQPPAAVVASAHVRFTADQLTLDFANSIPETDLNLKKQDYGDLTAVAVATDGKNRHPTLGTFGYDAYGKEAYEASAGIVTLKVDPAAAQKAQTADIQLRQKDGTVLLAETALRAVPMTPNIYLDAGETTTLSVQVLDRGRPAAAGIDVTLVCPNTAADASVTSTTDAEGIVTFPLAGETGNIEQYMLWPDKMRPPRRRSIRNRRLTSTSALCPPTADLADPNQTPPTWDNVQANVLKNWQAMAPCMDNWLDLGNPDQVKSFAPMLHKLTAKENFEAFRFMPVVRDMTAGQRALLYAFLDGPKPLAIAAKTPPRRSQRQLSRAMRGDLSEPISRNRGAHRDNAELSIRLDVELPDVCPIPEPAQQYRHGFHAGGRSCGRAGARAAAGQCLPDLRRAQSAIRQPVRQLGLRLCPRAWRADRSAISGLLVVELDDVSRVQRLRRPSAALRPRAAAAIEAGAGLRNLLGRNLLRQHMARPDAAKAR